MNLPGSNPYLTQGTLCKNRHAYACAVLLDPPTSTSYGTDFSDY